MKKYHFILLMLVAMQWTTFSQEQKNRTIVIEEPQVGLSAAQSVELHKIVLTDTSTVLSFTVQAVAGNWIFIPHETYIQAMPDGEQLFITSADGIPLAEFYTPTETKEMHYDLVFPALGEGIETFDYGEANEGGNWHIYDICTKPATNVYLPENLSGNWFNVSTGNWEVGFYPNHVFYQSKVWQYDTVKLNKKNGVIALKREGETLDVYASWDKKGNVQFGTSKENEVACVKDQTQIHVTAKADEYNPQQIFQLDSATYSGFIKGYTPRTGIKTMQIYINDILTGDQNAHVIEIEEDGYFSVKLPVYYPSEAFVRSDFYNGAVYLEPGKDVFQLLASYKQNNLFMGESAKVNSDLARLSSRSPYNYSELRSKILDMSPQDYKTWYLENLDEGLHFIDSMYSNGRIGAQAAKIKTYGLKYTIASGLMEYDRMYKSTYREKHDIPRSQRNLSIQIEDFPTDYYDFIDNAFVNDSMAIITSSYDIFVNRIAYMDELYERNLGYADLDILKVLEDAKVELSPREKRIVKYIKRQNEMVNHPEIKAFESNFGQSLMAFQNKYGEQLSKMETKHGKQILISDKGAYLEAQGVELTDDEQDLMQAIKALENSETYKALMLINEEWQEEITAFYKEYGSYLNEAMSNLRFSQYCKNLEQEFGVLPGLLTDIIKAQKVCGHIISQFTPITDEQIWEAQKQISTPFIDQYIVYCNEVTKQKIEANKRKTGYVVNDTPETEADKLFESIMAKYKGKVVYVDFWATWCGPCRSGIERIKSLKEEMKEENVAFVYLSSPSSPKGTWDNMIPDIKGEHYRLTNDEWNYLCDKFNISGIPHYVLVDKEGHVINGALGHMDNASLKKELEKHL